jgi:hypothetical protein
MTGVICWAYCAQHPNADGEHRRGAGFLDWRASVRRASARRVATLSLDHCAQRARIGDSAMLPAGSTVPRATESAQPAGEEKVCRIGQRPCRAPRPACGRLHRAAIVLVLALCAPLGAAGAAPAGQKFRADEWITECDGSPGRGGADCSIMVPFWQGEDHGRGSFALVVMLQTGNVGIVGQPFPVKAVLRVDKNPPMECRQTRYCIFPPAQSAAVVKQLEIGSLILIDVFTAKSQFSFSLTPKGYQAGIAQIRAWGYRLPTD